MLRSLNWKLYFYESLIRLRINVSQLWCIPQQKQNTITARKKQKTKTKQKKKKKKKRSNIFCNILKFILITFGHKSEIMRNDVPICKLFLCILIFVDIILQFFSLLRPNLQNYRWMFECTCLSSLQLRKLYRISRL